MLCILLVLVVLHFFPGKKRFIFSSFFITKNIFTHILCTTFSPVKIDLFFTVLKLNTIKQALIEKVQY